MLTAAAMAAMAFNSAQLGACHAVAHALGDLCEVPHGVANALMLPTVMAFNAGPGRHGGSLHAVQPQARYRSGRTDLARTDPLTYLGGGRPA